MVKRDVMGRDMMNHYPSLQPSPKGGGKKSWRGGGHEVLPSPQFGGEVRRNVEQGPRFSGCDRGGAHKHAGSRGAASRSGGPVERGAGAPLAGMRPWNRPGARRVRPYARLRGQIPRGAPLPPYDAPSKHNTLGTCSALRGRRVRGLATTYHVTPYDLTQHHVTQYHVTNLKKWSGW